VFLWIASDHIAWHWATGIAIDLGYGDTIQVVTMLVRPHLSDLCSTVLFVLSHLRLPSIDARSLARNRLGASVTAVTF
jgi:hypothetical protein